MLFYSLRIPISRRYSNINLKCKISTLRVCMMQPRVGFQQAKLTRLETELRSLHFLEKLNNFFKLNK